MVVNPCLKPHTSTLRLALVALHRTSVVAHMQVVAKATARLIINFDSQKKKKRNRRLSQFRDGQGSNGRLISLEFINREKGGKKKQCMRLCGKVSMD